LSHLDAIVRGYWLKGDNKPLKGEQTLKAALESLSSPLFCLKGDDDEIITATDGSALLGSDQCQDPDALPILAYVPPLLPATLGDAYFKSRFDLHYPYICGAMANGITSVEMVQAAGRAGMIGFFGAGGLAPDKIARAIDQIQSDRGSFPFGFNLIHSPHDPELEEKTVQLYLSKGVDLVSASAYLDLTLPLVYYRIKGIHQRPDGSIICPNRIIAKVSRVEVARKFLAPPPQKLLHRLIEQQRIRVEEAQLAQNIPMADALTAEADSGGHTDNRPALALLPTILALRDSMTAAHDYDQIVPVGLGGGIATPDAAAAAFSMGAAYILTGSINQACIEAGTSDIVRRMLAEAKQADVTMAPAADMFEMGVKLQVLKRGTMFPMRATKLYELYHTHNAYEEIDLKQRKILEQTIFQSSFEEEWQRTKSFFMQRDPKQIERAQANPKHKMALVFRSYLGQSSRWANSGNLQRKMDYQIWCGPAMGAFNEWAKGSFLQDPESRDVVTVALNLLYGACVQLRANALRFQGIPLKSETGRIRPLSRRTLQQRLNSSSFQSR
jgi:trans-AT polyketide synthase/acyltransferase/oxidoreductase domain-containing protein